MEFIQLSHFFLLGKKIYRKNFAAAAAASQMQAFYQRAVDCSDITRRRWVIHYSLNTSPTLTTGRCWRFVPPMSRCQSVAIELTVLGTDRVIGRVGMAHWVSEGEGGGGPWMDGWWGGKGQGWQSPRERQSVCVWGGGSWRSKEDLSDH